MSPPEQTQPLPAFPKGFDAYVCVGDRIEMEADGLTIRARIVEDDDGTAPDERQEGFWPSLYANDPGFIGPGNDWRTRFADQKAKAEAILQAWRDDEWFYCGIVLSVSADGDGELIELDGHASALWSIEANYLTGSNDYLREVADDLLPEAIRRGQEVLHNLCNPCPCGAACEAFT